MTESDEQDRADKINEATRERIAQTKPKELDLEEQINQDGELNF